VLDRNVWCAGAELDLVVRRGRVVAFVEVKSKSGDGHGDPLEMVTPVKVERVRRAAQAWLLAHPELDHVVWRFDVAAERRRRLGVVQDAF
jgi:putative endonuclease